MFRFNFLMIDCCRNPNLKQMRTMILRLNCIRLQSARCSGGNSINFNTVKFEMNGFTNRTIWCVCKRYRSSNGICISVRKCGSDSHIDNLYSPAFNGNAATVIRHCQSKLLCTYGTILCNIKRVQSLRKSTGHDLSSTLF